MSWLFEVATAYSLSRVREFYGSLETSYPLVYTLFCTFLILICHEGGGAHVTDPQVLSKLVAHLIADMALYVMTTVCLKIALGIFFLRVVIKPWQRYTIYAAMSVSVIYGIFYFFMAIFQCGLPSHALDNARAENCLPPSVVLGLGYTHGTINAVTDWTFGLLPAFVLWDSGMPRADKLSVYGILALGAIGSISSVVRLPYVRGLIMNENFFANAVNIAIWSVIEPGVGITAASLATLRPLLRCCCGDGVKETSQTRSFSSGANNLHRQLQTTTKMSTSTYEMDGSSPPRSGTTTTQSADDGSNHSPRGAYAPPPNAPLRTMTTSTSGGGKQHTSSIIIDLPTVERCYSNNRNTRQQERYYSVNRVQQQQRRSLGAPAGSENRNGSWTAAAVAVVPRPVGPLREYSGRSEISTATAAVGARPGTVRLLSGRSDLSTVTTSTAQRLSYGQIGGGGDVAVPVIARPAPARQYSARSELSIATPAVATRPGSVTLLSGRSEVSTATTATATAQRISYGQIGSGGDAAVPVIARPSPVRRQQSGRNDFSTTATANSAAQRLNFSYGRNGN
ncbi:hypothetical protein LTR66_005241 [Elasticomyces elasticus]|nr:hypothetical protein LTR66_005241 [Elasticomyces elasticus]